MEGDGMDQDPAVSPAGAGASSTPRASASGLVLCVFHDGDCLMSVGGMPSTAAVTRATRWEPGRSGGEGGSPAPVKFVIGGGRRALFLAACHPLVLTLEGDGTVLSDRVVTMVLRECSTALREGGDSTAASTVAPAGGEGTTGSRRRRVESVLVKYFGDGAVAGVDGDGGGVDHKQAVWVAVESGLHHIKTTAIDSIGLLVDREAKLDSLVDKSDRLVTRSAGFKKAARQVERQAAWDACRGYACLAATIAMATVILVIALL